MSYQVMKRHGETLNAYYQVKETNLKGHTLYDSNYRTFWVRKTMDKVRRSVVARGRERSR